MTDDSRTVFSHRETYNFEISIDNKFNDLNFKKSIIFQRDRTEREIHVIYFIVLAISINGRIKYIILSSE